MLVVLEPFLVPLEELLALVPFVPFEVLVEFNLVELVELLLVVFKVELEVLKRVGVRTFDFVRTRWWLSTFTIPNSLKARDLVTIEHKMAVGMNTKLKIILIIKNNIKNRK